MKSSSVILCVLVLALVSGSAYSQEATEPNPNLQCFEPFIGYWRYEGPLLEDVPDIAKKGEPFVFSFSWRWILDGTAVEENWSVEFEGGERLFGKSLICWNAQEKQIVYSGIDSSGMVARGVMHPGDRPNSLRLNSKTTNADGEATDFRSVIVAQGETVTWKAFEREGGIVEGPSPEYTYNRSEWSGRRRRPE